MRRSSAVRGGPQPTPHTRPFLIWGMALWLAGPGNLPLWHRILALPDGLEERLALIAAFGLLVLGVTVALLSLLRMPHLFRPLAALLALVAACNSYFMWQYGVVIDTTMLLNVSHTDAQEVRDLLSWTLLLVVLMVGGPAWWWLWRDPNITTSPWPRQLALNLAGALIGLGMALGAALMAYPELASLMRSHKDLRYMVNPLNTVYASGWLVKQHLKQRGRPLQSVGEDADLGASYGRQERPSLLLLVVGETARAQNWGLNGYERPTTPLLARWQAQGDLVNFSDVTSCGTNTQVSVPCLFSPLGRDQGGNQPAAHENLLDVLQRAGLAVLWVDNQSGCKGVCERVPNINLYDDPARHGCHGSGCFDEVLLQGLEERIGALDPQRRARGVVVVLHQMGSHGPAYFKRAPSDRKPFLPECLSITLSDCNPEQLRNAYDNSIAYTDVFLDQALTWLQGLQTQRRFDTGLIYVSDHGESLGENGLYLHGLPYALAPRQQTHVPMVTWLSAGLQQRSGVDNGCLRQRSTVPLSHDHFFHSVLGVLDVVTQARQDTLNLFAPCAHPPTISGTPAG